MYIEIGYNENNRFIIRMLFDKIEITSIFTIVL